MVASCVLFAGVAKFGGCSSANGGGGFAATCSEKQHVANVGQPGNWRSASTGEFGVVCSLHILLEKSFTNRFLLILNFDNCPISETSVFFFFPSSFQVGLLIDRLAQFLAKLKFTLTVLVTSWTEKKQRRQSAGTLLALNTSLCPLVLAVVALSALLSAPLLPLFTLPIFLVGFPRPQRSWPGPVGTACPCPDSIFYQQMSGSLASALRMAFARGSMGKFSLPLQQLMKINLTNCYITKK